MESGNSNLSFTHSGSLPPKSADAACWEGSPLKRQTIQTGLPLPPRILLSPSCGEHPYAADTPGTENTHCPRAGCAVWTQLSAKSSSRQPHPWMVSAALLQPMAKCSGDAGETVRSQMLQKPSVGGQGCVGTASQLSFATCPMLLSHCAVTKVDTSYINPPQHLLSHGYSNYHIFFCYFYFAPFFKENVITYLSNFQDQKMFPLKSIVCYLCSCL